MKISVVTKAVEKLTDSALLIPVFENPRRLSSTYRNLPKTLIDATETVFASGDFTGKVGQTQLVYVPGESPYPRVLLVGLGERRKYTMDTVRRTLGTAVQIAAKKKIGGLTVSPVTAGRVDAGTFAQAAAEGAILGDFQYADFLTNEDEIRFHVKGLTIAVSDRSKSRRVEKGVERGRTVAEVVNTSRWLVMTPGNDLYPETLAKETVKLAKTCGVKTTVLNPDQIKKLKMGGVWSVGKGSSRPPRFIIMEYRGNRRKKGIDVCLVGKGVTFDTGGISIKPNARMTEMIGDMMGSATVIAATIGVARLKLPINLVTIVPTVENMPSGAAYRPGDIVTTMSGQTVEIISTDAEGRLILADGLTYADRYQPKALIDVATLTGAAEIALGDQTAALLSNDPGLVKKFKHAAEATAERVWELPMFEEYAEQIKSDVADMKNSGGRLGGTITAAWFLRKYVGENKWAHLDIAAMDWETKGKPYIPKGCTGYGVRLLIQLLTDWK